MIPGSIMLGVYWGPRKENEFEFATRVSKFTSRLAVEFPQMDSWITMTGGRIIPPETKPRKMTMEDWLAAPLVASGKNALSRLANTGKRQMFCTSRDYSQTFLMRVTFGAVANWITNCCCLDFPSAGDQQLFESNRLLRALKLAIDAWDAEYGVVTTKDVVLACEGITLPVGWIVFRKGTCRAIQDAPRRFVIDYCLGGTIAAVNQISIPPEGAPDAETMEWLHHFSEGAINR